MGFKWIPIFLVGCFPLVAEIGFHKPWGKDSDLELTPSKPQPSTSFSVKTANRMILFYQRELSPTSGPRSSFRPSSSEYTRLAIQRYGFLKGFVMGCDRLLRENSEPWIYPKITEENRLIYKYDPILPKKAARRETFHPSIPAHKGMLSR